MSQMLEVYLLGYLLALWLSFHRTYRDGGVSLSTFMILCLISVGSYISFVIFGVIILAEFLRFESWNSVNVDWTIDDLKKYFMRIKQKKLMIKDINWDQ